MSESEDNWMTVLLKRGADPFDRIIWFLTIVMLGSLIFSTAVLQTSAVLLLVVWISKMIVRRRLAFHRTVLDVPLLVFMVARLVAIPLSVDPGVSLQALRTEIVFYPLYFVFTSSLGAGKPAEIRFLLKVVLVSAVIASIIGIVKHALGLVPRATSTTAGYYTLGLYLCVVLPLALVAWRDLFSAPWVRGGVCLLIMLGIVFTFDRLHWGGMILIVVTAGIVWERKLLAFLLLGGLALVLLSPPVANRLVEALNFPQHMSGRDVLWRGAFMIIGVHPVFGFGLRTFSLIFPLKAELTDPGVGSWHNDYLQVYMESGLVGLAAMLWFFFVIAQSAVKAYRRRTIPQGTRKTFAALLMATGVIFVVGGFLDTHVSLLFRFLFAILAPYLSAEPSNVPVKTV